MTTPAYVRLYQEGHARTTGYALTEWVDASGSSPIMRTPFVLADGGPETPDYFERVASPLDLVFLDTNPLMDFDPLGGTVDPIAPIVTSLALGTTTLGIAATGYPEWTNDTAINTYTYAADVDGYYPFVVTGISTHLGSAGLTTTITNTLLAPGHVFTDEDLGRWIYLTGFATSANNGPARIDAYAGSLLNVFRPAGAFVAEVGDGYSRWDYKRVRIALAKPFPSKGARRAWRVKRGATSVNSGSAGVCVPAVPGTPLYLSDRATLLFPTLPQATDHSLAVRTYLSALQIAQGTVTDDTTFGTLGPFDYPA